jgi:hypothetical protein
MSIKLILDESLLNYKERSLSTCVIGETVGQCLDKLVLQQPYVKELIFDESGNILSINLIIINGHLIHPSDKNTAVNDGDEIIIHKHSGG